MKINFLNGNLIIRENKSGVHFFHQNIMKGLLKAGVQLNTSFFNFNNRKSKLIKAHENDWIRENIIQCKYIHRIFVYILPIELFFGKSDIYICDGWIPITLFKSKKIAIVHDLMSFIYPENYKFILKIYLYIFFKQIKRADKIIAVSNTTKDDLIKYLHIPKEKIEVVFNGVNINQLETNKFSGNNTNIDLKRKYIFYIGEMRKNKNLISALKGFEKYCDLNKEECYFYIAGKKAFEYENLLQYINKSSIKQRVVFLGYVSEELKVELYKNAFSFLFVSLYEGFGIPILEAMACKTPVITSNCSSMKEIAEKSAILVDPENIDEIANALRSLDDENTRKYIIEKGYNNAKKFSWENSVIKFKDILNKLSMEINKINE